MTKISIAIACVPGMGTALAQTVQRGDVTAGSTGGAPQTMAQASTAGSIQTAQAGAADWLRGGNRNTVRRSAC
jgi:hypothetical protein